MPPWQRRQLWQLQPSGNTPASNRASETKNKVISVNFCSSGCQMINECSYADARVSICTAGSSWNTVCVSLKKKTIDWWVKTIHGFIKWTTVKIGTEHQEQWYNYKLISESKRKYVSWVIGCSGLILEHECIFSNLIRYCCHGIKVSGFNYSLRLKLGDRLECMTLYVDHEKVCMVGYGMNSQLAPQTWSVLEWVYVLQAH